MHTLRKKNHAFTIIELMVGASVSLAVGLFIASTVITGSILFAKNTATNLTHNSLRSAIDRMEQDITMANGGFTLVTVNGATVAAGAAAGVVFDKVLGNPYLVTPPTATGIIATTSAVTITRTTAVDATYTPARSYSPPLPATDDVILIDGEDSTRLRVWSAAAGAVDATTSSQALSITLTSPVGKAIDWVAPSTKNAKLVRKSAYVVVPVGARNELRYYPTAEGIVDYSLAAGYVVIENNIGTDAGDNTPFSTTTITGTASRGSPTKSFLKMTVRIRTQGYDQVMLKREANKFSSVQRVEFLMFPRVTN